jgi:hypothetical protein
MLEEKIFAVYFHLDTICVTDLANVRRIIYFQKMFPRSSWQQKYVAPF